MRLDWQTSNMSCGFGDERDILNAGRSDRLHRVVSRLLLWAVLNADSEKTATEESVAIEISRIYSLTR